MIRIEAQLADVTPELFEMGVAGRDLIIWPINDSRSGRADSGSHWTVLVCWRCGPGWRDAWHFMHLAIILYWEYECRAVSILGL